MSEPLDKRPQRLLLRLAVAAALLIAGGLVLSDVVALYGTGARAIAEALALALIGLSLASLGGVLLATPLANLLMWPFVTRHTLAEDVDVVPLRYLHAELAWREGRFAEAFDSYAVAAERGVAEAQPYRRMMEIAAGDMHDAARLQRALDEGVARLDDEAERLALRAHHASLRDAMDEGV